MTVATVPNPGVDLQGIRTALDLFIEPGSVVELRALKTSKGTQSGYFTDLDAMARAAAGLSGRAEGVYFTLNPVHPDLLARAANRVEPYAKHATDDRYIVQRRWLLIDCDPVRPAGISATEEEKSEAGKAAVAVKDWLGERGWPEPVMADSGNGYHLLYRIDLPNAPESTALVGRVLKALAAHFSTERVKLDTAVGNAARITKLYGTLARKGDSTPSRPHRPSFLFAGPDVPASYADVPVVPQAYIEALLQAEAPPMGTQSAPVKGHGSREELGQWIAAHGLHVQRDHPWDVEGGQGYIWELSQCPWNPEHTDGAAYVGQLPNGARTAGCHHDGCKGKDWRELRDLVEPRTAGPEVRAGAVPPPKLADDAYYGLAGELVRAIEPHTEADPAALLVQILTAFGNVVGRGPFFRVEADEHHTNLDIVLVGATSKGRKGTSWGHVRRLIEAVDPEWEADHIKGGLASGEGLIWHVRDPMYEWKPVKEKGRTTGIEHVMVDGGVADKRLLAYEAEYASVLKVAGRDGSILSELIRAAWDTGTLQTLTKNSPATATGAHISIIGHITRDELRACLDNVEMANGFANRHLWVWTERSKSLPRGGNLQDAELAPLVEWLKAAVMFAHDAGEIARDKDAWALWEQVYDDLAEGQPGLVGAVLARAEAQVTRLSCLYALLDNTTVVRVEHLRAALAVWSYTEASARYIFGDALGDPVADRILAAARQRGEIDREAIVDLFDRHVRRARMDEALELLLKAKLLVMEKQSTGGRPREVWRPVAE
jgi:hypothetical protein